MTRDTVTRLKHLSAGAVSDALGKTGAMDHEIRPRSRNARLAGPAFTLRIHTADILMVGKALSECPKGAVLVIDGRSERNTAIWGGLTTQAALRKGVAGVVIDGAIRDIADIGRSRLPVFARAIVANAGGAEYAGELQVPVQCGGVVVNPGDWVVGDEDGVVVVPRSRLEEVMAIAGRILAAESRIARQIRSGKDFGAILQCDQALERKRAETFIPQLRAAGKATSRRLSNS